MGQHSPLTAKTIIAKQNRHGERVQLSPADCQLASIKAQLFYAATVGNDPDAREQLRLLDSITDEGREAYEEIAALDDICLMGAIIQTAEWIELKAVQS